MRGTSMAQDRYDYAAAFENLRAVDRTPIVEIPAIAGKTPEELRALLGAPEICETTRYSSRCRYSPGQTEVVFIDGRADWITVADFGETPFAPQALMRLGLPQAPPVARDAEQMQWSELAGLKRVQLVGDGKRIEFARVKARTD
ncbi:MAG: hypothetical protein IRZ06_04200 [Nevskia sp.]|nr:hypothetical protein [Nevskia sp.]